MHNPNNRTSLKTAAAVIAALLLAGASVWLLRRGFAAKNVGLAAIHVPAGFEVQRIAGPPLVTYPMMGTLDDRGRLFLCESSGHKLNNDQMSARPDYRIRMLEDLDGDGVYDRSTVFADKLTLPAGAVWYRGSLYVASPPDLIRFDDLNGDGVAERREVIVTGWNLSSNAASLHGPFLGPDGWLYLTDGRHGFKIKTKEGPTIEGKASRIWRVRPDGSGLEWVSGGGFDNPVELIFTPPGEIIGTMTYFTDPKDGQRDALLHFVEGGVYPKPHPSAAEFKRTGDWMPVMTKFARIAPSGLERYRGASFGPAYQGNLFSAQFNPHRVQRHIVFRDGATFRTEDEDFLTSADPDFHPTDVMEDADGSLIVVDTGAWFIHGCPISRISKPEIKGAIYRVRKTGARPEPDPRGRAARLEAMPLDVLAQRLRDPRPVVRDRALDLLVERGEAAVQTLAFGRENLALPEFRCAAVFGLFRIGTPKAQAAVRAALSDADFSVRIAAARSAGMARDRAAVERLMEMAQRDELPVRRQAAASLGQIGDPRATRALLAAAAEAQDRFIEHSIIYSLMELHDRPPLLSALADRQPRVRKAALIALDQMDASSLDRRHIAPFLGDPDRELRNTTLWVVSHHPAWSGEVLKYLRSRLAAPELAGDEADAVREALLAFSADPAVQKMVAEMLGSPALASERRLFLLDTIDHSKLKELPAVWIEQIGKQLDAADTAVRMRAVGLIRSRAIVSLDDSLDRIANGPAAPDDLRTAAFGALVGRRPRLLPTALEFLLHVLNPKPQSSTDAALRLAAAEAVGRADLSHEQLLLLARSYVPKADPLVIPSLLEAFRNCRESDVGRALVAALLNSPMRLGDVNGKRLKKLISNFPPDVQSDAKPLLARLEQEQKARVERLRKLEPLLTAGGDVGRGRRVFFGQKVACANCHTIGAEGGHVGPDLTGIGAIRSGHDLLEAIVFPAASFVPGFEVYRVETAGEALSGLIVERTPEAVVVLTGPQGAERIPRNKIVSIKPSEVSLMPDGLDDALTASELTDLLAFLQSQKSRQDVIAGSQSGRPLGP